MNYQKHYDLLIERARTRLLESNQYRERHHVIPRCLGGSDESDNIVELTPEEHYVAHQLLVKMYPHHEGLVWAALQMTGHTRVDSRTNNKLYGWLRRKYKSVAKQRKGKKNGSYGRHWYHHPETLDNVKCKPDEVPEGYIKGRKLKSNNKCKVCGIDISHQKNVYCHLHKYQPIKEEAIALFEEFLESDHETITSFAHSKGVSQPNMSTRFRRHVPNYRKIINGTKDKRLRN